MSAKKSFLQAARTLIPVLFLLIITVFTTGCFKGEANLTIHDDGSAALKTRLLGTDFLKEAIIEATNEMKKKDSAAVVKEISEGDKTGFEITSEYPDMKTLAEKGGDLFTRRDGKAAGIQQKKTWFYDAYALDLYAGPSETGNDADGDDPAADAMMKGFLNQIHYEFCLTLPEVPEKHNADRTEDGGKTLRWDLAPTLAAGGDKHIQVEFRLWNKPHIMLTAAVAIVSLALAVLFFILRQKSAPEKRGMKQILAIVFAVLALVVFAFSAWQLTAAFGFAAEDSISPAYVKDVAK